MIYVPDDCFYFCSKYNTDDKLYNCLMIFYRALTRHKRKINLKRSPSVYVFALPMRPYVNDICYEKIVTPLHVDNPRHDVYRIFGFFFNFLNIK